MPRIFQYPRLTGLAIILILTTFIGGFEQSSIRLKPESCDIEDNLRSLNSQISTNIQFINRNPFRVKVYWIDFRGKRQHYFDLESNQIYEQQTFVTHPWLITEASPNQPCINIFFPQARSGIVIIN